MANHAKLSLDYYWKEVFTLKNTDPVANTKIYLATSFFNEEQRARIPQALAQLEANPTVGVVHQPFDFQYKDARVDSDPAGVFCSHELQISTYNNDLNAAGTSDVCVALYDMDQIDEGICMEIGMFVALHKPIVLLPFTKKDKSAYEANLLLARWVTTWLEPNDISHLKDLNFNQPMAQHFTTFHLF